AFLTTAWASHAHVHKADPHDVVSLLSLDDVDQLLTSTALRTPALRVAKNGSVLPSSAYTRSATIAGAQITGLVDARRVVDLFDGGATLVLQGLHRYWRPLTELIRDLESALGHSCQANAYLTPPGSQGFALHSDAHDVLVFQTYGTKQWEIHDRGSQLDVSMEPGTTIYLPTGTPHAARTQESASLHVTIGINQSTWRQLLQRVVTDALADEAYNQRLPVGYPDDPTRLAMELRTQLDALAGQLGRLAPDDLAAAQARRFLTTRTPALRGTLTDRLAVAALDDNAELVRRPGSVCVVRETPDQVCLLLGDRELRLPARLGDVLRHVSRQSTLRPGDLADWLDPESRLVLTRRLVREGLLQVTG
ncbi:MAG: cupin, partial [Propionibacteriales bacterium]|nr:cupin [Propionibacteriales bacterium]